MTVVAGPPPRALDSRALRTCVGGFATGVTVVTYADDDGQPRGATVNSFTSVSLDPALVLVSLARKAKACELLHDRAFAVNVLCAEQLPVALQFAGRPNSDLDVRWVDGLVAPRLARCAAWLECRPWRQHEAGDHVLFLGEVLAFEHRRAEPLLFHGGDFHMRGVPLHQSPNTVVLDGRPVPGFLRAARRLHEHVDAV